MTKGQLLAGQYSINLSVLSKLTDDISEEDSCQYGQNKATPIKWLVGHLSYYASFVLQLLDVPCEYDSKWGELFRGGAVTDINDDNYPPFKAICAKLAELDNKVVEKLNGISDEELEKVITEDYGLFKGMPLANVILFLVNHEFYHFGQVTTIRRRVLDREQPFG